MSLPKYKNFKALNEVRTVAMNDTVMLRDALEHMHKELAASNMLRGTRVQRVHNSKNNVALLIIMVGDYVMIRTHHQREQKLQSIWRGSMLVKEAKSDLFFVVEDLTNALQYTVRAHRIVPYPITKHNEKASEEILQQVAHLDKKYHLVDEITGVRKRKGAYEIRKKWIGFNDDEDVT